MRTEKKIFSSEGKYNREDNNKRFREAIRDLYNLFVEPINPNNPRYRDLLTGQHYTLRYLGEKMGINEIDVYNLLNGLFSDMNPEEKNSIYKMYIKERNNLWVLDIFDMEKFKSQIIKIYQIVFREKNKQPIQFKFDTLERERERLSDLEIKYLRLIFFRHKTGIFNILKPNIPREYFKNRSNLKFTKPQRQRLMSKCLKLNIVEKVGENDYKFTSLDFLKYF